MNVSPERMTPAAGVATIPWYRAMDPAAWKAWLGSFLGWVFDGYETYTLVLVASVAVPQLINPASAAQTPTLIAGAFAITLVGWAIGGILGGILSDYIGRKRMLMISILWYAIFAGLTALAPNYVWFIVARLLTGVGLGAEWGPGTAMVAEVFPASARGRGAGMLGSGSGFGFLLATIVWTFVHPLGDSSWRYMFVLGILPALVLLYLRRGVREPELWSDANGRRHAARAKRSQNVPLTAEEHADARFTMARILANATLRRRTLLLLVMALSTIMGWWAVSTWIPQYAASLAPASGLNPVSFAHSAALVYNVAGIAGYLAMAWLLDLWGRKPTIILFYLGSLVTVPLLFLVVRDSTAVLVAIALNGIFTLGQFTWLAVYPAELFPTAARGSGISLIFDSTRMLAAVGTLGAGLLITTLGGIGLAATVFGMIYLLGLLAVPWAGPETRGAPLPE